MRTRIAVVRQSYRDDGGAERFVSRLLSVIGTPDIDVTLITRRWQKLTDDQKHVNMHTCNPGYLGRLTREWRFSRAVRRFLGTECFDLVQTNERIPGCDIYRAGDGIHCEWLRQKARGQSRFGHFYSSLSPYHVYLKQTEKRLLEHPRLKAVICNSKMVKSEILRNFSVDASKIHVIYNGLDMDYFSPATQADRGTTRQQLGLGADVPVFLFVGSGFERKGLAAGIKALGSVPGAHLVVVGNAKRNSKYLALAQRVRCSDRIHFVGVVSDVRPYYGMADALLLPTLYDPFPNVILEAMGCGLPVVTTTCCGAIDIVEDGNNGFICDALDVSAISVAMTHLSDRQAAQAIGQKARNTVLPLTAQHMQNELTTLYENLMEQTRVA